MEAMPGWGLAAPQIGVGLRLAVVDVSDSRGQVIYMADPEITPVEDAGTAKGPEGSPCLGSILVPVPRFRKVVATFTDAGGNRVTRQLEGNWAISAQHQMDHLNGKLIIDRLSRTKRDMVLRKFRKLGG